MLETVSFVQFCKFPSTEPPKITKKLVTRQTDVSTFLIQIPANTTTSPTNNIPNGREIRDWVIVDKQIGLFYEV